MAEDDPDAGEDRFPEDERVGYGRPPKEHRFKKGNNANPNGRKGKPRPRKDFLEQRRRYNVDGKWCWLSYDDVMTRALVKAATAGNVSAYKAVKAEQRRRAAETAETVDSHDAEPARFLARIMAQRKGSRSDDEGGDPHA